MGKGVVLVVDDDAFFRTVCSDILTGGGFSVVTASSGTQALDIIQKKEDVDLVITDLVMPDIGGLEVLEGVKQHNTLADVIVVTGHGSIDTAITALKKGAFDYINKPLNEDELLHTVNTCMEKKKLLEENTEMRQSLKLFEVSWAVTNTIEKDKLYEASLDAMLQIVPANAGFLLAYNFETKRHGVKAARHIEPKEAAAIYVVLKDFYAKGLEEIKKITLLSTEDLKEAAGDGTLLSEYGSMLLVPVMGTTGAAAGLLIILNRAGKGVYGVTETKFAAFVAEHISIAFENVRKLEEAQKYIFVDSLTNLYNSKYLDKMLDRELKRADRLNSPVTLFFIDIDNFKNINDANDHLVGSRVLVEMGGIFLKCVREVDTVIRYGGDEYVIILVDADYDSALMVAERIRTSVEETSFLHDEGLDIRITVSIGVATYPVHTKDKRELIRIADRAMYRAKDISRNTVFLAPVPGA